MACRLAPAVGALQWEVQWQLARYYSGSMVHCGGDGKLMVPDDDSKSAPLHDGDRWESLFSVRPSNDRLHRHLVYACCDFHLLPAGIHHKMVNYSSGEWGNPEQDPG